MENKPEVKEEEPDEETYMVEHEGEIYDKTVKLNKFNTFLLYFIFIS